MKLLIEKFFESLILLKAATIFTLFVWKREKYNLTIFYCCNSEYFENETGAAIDRLNLKFRKIAGKHQCQSLFFSEIVGLKKGLHTGVFQLIFKTF